MLAEWAIASEAVLLVYIYGAFHWNWTILKFSTLQIFFFWWFSWRLCRKNMFLTIFSAKKFYLSFWEPYQGPKFHQFSWISLMYIYIHWIEDKKVSAGCDHRFFLFLHKLFEYLVCFTKILTVWAMHRVNQKVLFFKNSLFLGSFQIALKNSDFIKKGSVWSRFVCFVIFLKLNQEFFRSDRRNLRYEQKSNAFFSILHKNAKFEEGRKKTLNSKRPLPWWKILFKTCLKKVNRFDPVILATCSHYRAKKITNFS